MLKVFKCNPSAILPSYATERAACFDVCACLTNDSTAKAKFPASLRSTEDDVLLSVKDNTIIVPPLVRVLVPTGLKFDIPENHSLRLHPRSGLAFKNGINLANCQGVIDEDYIEEVFVAIMNNSNIEFTIKHGDRICQGELVVDSRAQICETQDAPVAKSSRQGGFGSTGV